MNTEPGAVLQETQKPAPTTENADVVDQQAENKQEHNDSSGEPQGKTTDETKKLKSQVSRLLRQRQEARGRNDALEAQIQELRDRIDGLSNSDGESGDDVEIDIDAVATEKASLLAKQNAAERDASRFVNDGKKLEGFAKALDELKEEIPLVREIRHGKIRATIMTPFMEALVDCDPSIVVYLGENIEEAADISALSPTQIGRRLARIEARLAAESVKSKPEPVKKPIETPSASSASGSSELDKALENARAGIRGRR